MCQDYAQFPSLCALISILQARKQNTRLFLLNVMGMVFTTQAMRISKRKRCRWCSEKDADGVWYYPSYIASSYQHLQILGTCFPHQILHHGISNEYKLDPSDGVASQGEHSSVFLGQLLRHFLHGHGTVAFTSAPLKAKSRNSFMPVCHSIEPLSISIQFLSLAM